MAPQQEQQTLGEFLRARREELGDSMAELARRMKMREQQVSYVESDQVAWLNRIPDRLRQYAEAYQVPLEEVVRVWLESHGLPLP